MENTNSKKTTFSVIGYFASDRDYYTGGAEGYDGNTCDYGVYETYADAKKAFERACDRADWKSAKDSEIICIESYTCDVDEDGDYLNNGEDFSDTLKTCDCFAEYVAGLYLDNISAYEKLLSEIDGKEGFALLGSLSKAVLKKLQKRDYPAEEMADCKGKYTISALIDEMDEDQEDELLEQVHSLPAVLKMDDCSRYF